MIDTYVDRLAKEGIQFRNITLRKRIIISKEDIAGYFYSMDKHMPIPNRMEYTLKWLLKEIEKHQDIEKHKDWVMNQVELLDREDYLQAYYKSQEGEEVDSRVEEEFLRDEVVQRVFASIKKRLKNYAFVHTAATYKNLFKTCKLEGTPQHWEDICRLTVKGLTEKSLFWEEATPFSYFKDQLVGALEDRSLRYLFIDEAQDLTPFQFAYINFLFPYTRMTMLGDINQAIYSYASKENPLLLNNPEDEERITLTKSYRSTKQIVEFTTPFAPGGEEIIPFNREGVKPQLIEWNDNSLLKIIKKQIEKMMNSGHESIAIICKTMKETNALYKKLKEIISIHLIHEETYTFQKGIVILPVYLAKGIEFDAVIIPNASNDMYNKEADQTLFYTACTRAMHELVMLINGEMSRFIQMVSEEKYERL